MAARLALALRHVEFEDCGTLAPVLLERGFALRYVDVAREDLSAVDSVAPDLLIGLGGPVSVYQASEYPWIAGELRLLERRVRAAKPVLGICLGSQMLARVLGARVFAAPVKELGWKPLELTREGESSAVGTLGARDTSMLHWHGDTFDLPAGARLLASTAQVRHQIYEWGGHVLAFQCHPEARAADIESWLIGHAAEIAATPGAEVGRLRADTARFGPALARCARAAFERWLTAVGL
jgi:GMP synthase (glutamine-hydrolysing)